MDKMDKLFREIISGVIEAFFILVLLVLCLIAFG